MDNIAGMIDHTLLKADATQEAIVQLAAEAKQYGFASVCVNPAWVKIAAEELAGTEVKVCTVIGFPLGASATAVKAYETRAAIADGAQEVDMVIAVGALKSGLAAEVEQDIRAVVEAAAGQALVKVIIETSLLTDREKELACELAALAGADYVKTSTGFSTGGATAADVALMRAAIPARMKVKASGGIRSYEDARAMIEAGASRLGCSSGVQIMQGLRAASDY